MDQTGEEIIDYLKQAHSERFVYAKLVIIGINLKIKNFVLFLTKSCKKNRFPTSNFSRS